MYSMNNQFFRRPVKNSILYGLPFGIFMGFYFHWVYGPGSGIFGGVFSGILFGVAMAVFGGLQRKRMQSMDATFEGEAVISQGPANHFRKAEGRGGWLYLTSTRMAFRSHGKNIQNQPIDIDIQEILEARPTRLLGFIPTGLSVFLKAGGKESFVVSKRKEWTRQISGQIQAGQDPEEDQSQ